MRYTLVIEHKDGTTFSLPGGAKYVERTFRDWDEAEAKVNADGPFNVRSLKFIRSEEK